MIPVRRVLKWTAVSIGTVSVVAGLALGAGLSQPLDPIPQFGTRPDRLVIANVTIIDVADGTARPDQTVTIEGGKIVSVARAVKDANRPAGAMVIDGKDKFLIPGLWDAHVHTLALSDRLHFPLMLAHGVTTIRNMGDGCSWRSTLDCVADRDQWQPSAQGPRIIASAGYHIEQLDSAEDAERLVKAIKARGDDLIKIQLDDESDPDASKFAALVRASGRLSVPATGHVPSTARLTDSLFEALVSIEHDSQLMPLCRADEPVQCNALLATLAQRRTAYVPTHIASTGQDLALARHQPEQDALLPFNSSALAAIWRAYRWLHRSSTDVHDLRAFKQIHRDALRLTLKAQRAGVPILAGTDALDPFVLHGPALHQELAYLARAGLSPAEVLRAATMSPTMILGEGDETATIGVGNRADLVLLNHNPLSDIAATQAINTVIANGVVYGPDERVRMMAFVKQQAARFSVGARSWWALAGFDPV